MNEAGGALRVYTTSLNVIIEPVPNLTGFDFVRMSAKLRERSTNESHCGVANKTGLTQKLCIFARFSNTSIIHLVT